MGIMVRLSEERQIRACREMPKLKSVRGHWEVHTFTLCDGWVNCWQVEQDGVTTPETFASRDEAAKALREHIADYRIEAEMGQRSFDEVPSMDEFQIVFVEC